MAYKNGWMVDNDSIVVHESILANHDGYVIDNYYH